MAISSIKFNLNPRVIKALNLYEHCSKINEGLRELEARRSIRNLGKYSKRERGWREGGRDEEREGEGEGGSSRGKGRQTIHTWDTKVEIEDVRDNHERTIRIWREYRRVKNISRLQNCGNRKAII